MQSATSTPDARAQRRRIRTDGSQSLADVAEIACGDRRLTALVHDLNPALPLTGRLRAGTIVMCPARSEAQAFAKRMGFAVGIVEGGPSGTGAQRLWAEHVGAARPAPDASAEALARALLARGVPAGEAGRRLAGQCREDEIKALVANADPKLRAVGAVAELHALFPQAKRRLHAVRSVLRATARPGGLRAVVEACGRAPAAAEAVLLAAAIAAPLRAALTEEAPRVVVLLERARQLVQLERGARDAALKTEEHALAALVDALADGVEPLSGERIEALGLGDEAHALLAHAAQLEVALSMAEASLARTPDAIRALALGTDARALPRPWPLVAAVCRALGKHLDALPPTARDDGLGGLVPRRGSRVSAEGAPACLSVAELQARAAACARADDEGDALAARLAPTILELFALLRPPPAVDGGTPNVRRARRRAAFDLAIAARGAVSAEGTAALATEALSCARACGLGCAARLSGKQLEAAAEVARALQPGLSVQRRPMSELGRALVVAAMAIDRDIGQGLSRPTGREALALCAQRHAARALSAAACRLAAAA